MPDKFIQAVDTRTGKKMRVPAQWPDLFSHIKPRSNRRQEKPAARPAAPPQAPNTKNESKKES